LPPRKGNGAGWGGPPKGETEQPERYVFDEAGPGRGHKGIEGEARRKRNEQRTEALEQFYWDVARGEAHDENLPIRLSAATLLLNRLAPIVKDENAKPEVVIIVEGGLPPRPQ
jgi:hypothetical protein